MEKNALIIGIRNEDSICYAIAKELKKNGYRLYATYQDKIVYPDVKRCAEELGIAKLYQYNAIWDEELNSFTGEFIQDNIMLDVIVHGIAYSSSTGALINQSLLTINWEEFTDAIRVGAFSLVEVVGRLFEKLNQGASIIAISSRWSKLAVPGFNVIGAAKASLESIIRGLAEDLGRIKQIRVNGISAGPVLTHSLSKLGNALEILEVSRNKSPLKKNVAREDIARLALTVLENRSLTGTIYPVDCGMDIMGI